jgi:bacillithiol biosynthesis deacetylase BshB1
MTLPAPLAAATPLNILVVAAHPDDAEIGMGATIAKLADQGHRILICDLTDGSPTPRGDRASRLIEAQHALAPLQPGNTTPSETPRVSRLLLDLPNRTLEHSIATRHALAGVIRLHQARVVFLPHWEDAHPDHLAATRIAEDARFDAKLTKIEMPVPPGATSIGPPIYPTWLFYYHISHLRHVAPPHFLIDTSGYESQKLASIRAYRSQFGPWDDAPAPAPGTLVTPDFPERMLSYLTYWGSRIGTTTAEPFWTKEPLGLTSLSTIAGL